MRVYQKQLFLILVCFLYLPVFYFAQCVWCPNSNCEKCNDLMGPPPFLEEGGGGGGGGGPISTSGWYLDSYICGTNTTSCCCDNATNPDGSTAFQVGCSVDEYAFTCRPNGIYDCSPELSNCEPGNSPDCNYCCALLNSKACA